MSDDFLVWEPDRGQPRATAESVSGNTAKEAATAYVRADYARDQRRPEERILHVERISDGLRWIVHLEPVVLVNWRGVATPIAKGRGATPTPVADAPSSCDNDPPGGFSGR